MKLDELRARFIEITKTKPYSFEDTCRMYTKLIQTGLESEVALKILEDGLYYEYMAAFNTMFDSKPMVDAFKALGEGNSIIDKIKRMLKKAVDYLG